MANIADKVKNKNINNWLLDISIIVAIKLIKI